MKRAFLIAGPESSGNHAVSRLFAECGVFGKTGYGKTGMVREDIPTLLVYFWYDCKVDNPYDLWGEAMNGDVFLGQSAPCEHWEYKGQELPTKVIANYRKIKQKFVKEGFRVIWIVPVRNHYITAQSQEKRNFQMFDSDNRFEWIKKLYKEILLQIYAEGDDVWLFPTADIWNNYEVVKKELKDYFGLDLSDNMQKISYNADEKYVRTLREEKDN